MTPEEQLRQREDAAKRVLPAVCRRLGVPRSVLLGRLEAGEAQASAIFHAAMRADLERQRVEEDGHA